MKNPQIISALCIVTIIVVVTFSFSLTLPNGFTNWDDPLYVTENSLIRELSPTQIGVYFSRFFHHLYQPLVLLSFSLEYHFFGLNPAVYHFTNLLLHLFNTLLVFWFIFLLCRNSKIAFLTALLFGIHPMRVQSVAWITERKDVLFSFFYLLSLIFYLYYRHSGGKKYYAISLCSFFLSLLSKPISITLPLALLLCDYYLYRERDNEPAAPGKRKKKPEPPSLRSHAKTMLLEKIPFFAGSLLLAAAYLAEHLTAEAAGSAPSHFSILTFVFTGSYSLLFSLGKILLPVNLSFVYPRPEKLAEKIIPLFGIYPLLLLVITVLVARYLRKNRVVIFSLLFYATTLMPGLLLCCVSGSELTAERFTYIPSIGLAYLIAEGFFWLHTRKTASLGPVHAFLAQVLLVFALAAILGCLGFITVKRCTVWQDSITFWTDVISQNKGYTIAYYNRAKAFEEQGDAGHALEDYSRAISLRPSYKDSYFNRGRLYLKTGDLQRALEDFDRVIILNPQSADAYLNRGITLYRKGDFERAIGDFNQAARLRPDLAEAYYNRGIIYCGMKDFRRGLEDYNQAILINPGYADAYCNRGSLHFCIGEPEKALKDYGTALKLRPDYADAYYNRALLFSKMKLYARALIDYNRAIEYRPDYLKARYNRAIVFYLLKEYDSAWSDVKKLEEAGYPVNESFLRELEKASGKDGESRGGK